MRLAGSKGRGQNDARGSGRAESTFEVLVRVIRVADRDTFAIPERVHPRLVFTKVWPGVRRSRSEAEGESHAMS